MGDSESSSAIWFKTINLAVTAGVGAAALAWAIKAYNIGVASLHTSTLANQLALVQACQQSNGSLDTAICSSFLQIFNDNIAAIAATVAKGNATFIDILPIVPSAPKPHEQLSIGALIGSIFAAVFGFISINVALIQLCYSRNRRDY